jgi:hypothetical protein
MGFRPAGKPRMNGNMIDRLVRSGEAGVRYKLRVEVLGEDTGARAIKRLREEVRESERVRALLSECDAEGRIARDPYSKWRGAHWVLAALADIGYPPGDASLIPLREQALRTGTMAYCAASKPWPKRAPSTDRA